jgi:hypothetical protein
MGTEFGGPMVANDGLIPSESMTLEMSKIIYARPIFYYVHKSINSILTHLPLYCAR